MTEKLALCTRYTALGGSSRLRFLQWQKTLAEAGYEIEVFPFFPEKYLDGLYRTGRKSRLLGTFALLRRSVQSFHLPKKLLIEYELFPQLPWKMEAFFLHRRRYVVNFDDNVWEKYRHSPLEGKYDEVVRHASGVIAANRFLYDRVKVLNENVLLLPTVIDLERYRRTAPEKPERFTIVWIGTPATFHYVEQISGVLQTLAKELDFELKIIARRSLENRSIPGVRMRFIDWSPETEIAELKSSDAGIMPLADDPFSRGKSAFKLIQYLGSGLPAVASPVGENCNVLTPECGLLAETPEAWLDALRRLARDSGFRQKIGAGALLRAEEYSMEKYRPQLVDFLRRSL